MGPSAPTARPATPSNRKARRIGASVPQQVPTRSMGPSPIAVPPWTHRMGRGRLVGGRLLLQQALAARLGGEAEDRVPALGATLEMRHRQNPRFTLGNQEDNGIGKARQQGTADLHTRSQCVEPGKGPGTPITGRIASTSSRNSVPSPSFRDSYQRTASVPGGYHQFLSAGTCTALLPRVRSSLVASGPRSAGGCGCRSRTGHRGDGRSSAGACSCRRHGPRCRTGGSC